MVLAALLGSLDLRVIFVYGTQGLMHTALLFRDRAWLWGTAKTYAVYMGKAKTFQVVPHKLHNQECLQMDRQILTVLDFRFSRRQQRSRDSALGIATGYGLDDRGAGVRVPVGSRIFSSPPRLVRLWGPSSLLPNGYLGLFPRG
jgi:hypothetical protein